MRLMAMTLYGVGRINKRKHELYELHINEQEAAVVRIVFDKYVYEATARSTLLPI